ncbi:MAG: hypothetical protein COA78_32030 [Blastopirellula sp.]|nr:MAG: hypothetical protein COA78_32030 [Blastopirellula sp.]
MGWSAQLRNGSSALLNTHEVSTNPYSFRPSCQTQSCQSSGNSIDSWQVIDFPENPGSEYLYASYLDHAQFQSEFAQAEYYALVLDSNSSVQFENKFKDVRIRYLDVGYNAELVLSSGIYWVDNLSVSSNAEIRTKGDGPVWIMVRNPIRLGSRSNMTGANSDSALGLIAYDGITLDSKARFSGLIYSQGRAYLNWQAKIEGTLIANAVDLLSGSTVTYLSNIFDSLDFLQISPSIFDDMDNDGIADDEDEDIDGDGINNDLEIQAGTDPLDEMSVPLDKNRNGIPDVLETRVAVPNQCTAPFVNALQSHELPASVIFSHNAYLKNTSSSTLDLLDVRDHNRARKQSCFNQSCEASGNLITIKALPSIEPSAGRNNEFASYDSTLNISPGEFHYVEADAYSTIRFEQGDYKIKGLYAYYGARIELAAGDYWLDDVWLGANTQIVVKGQGTARLHIKNKFVSHWRSQINSKGAVKKLFIASEGTVYIGPESILKALVVTKELYLAPRARLRGSAVSAETKLAPFSRIVFKPKAILKTDFGGWCDLDGDSIYDGFDLDRDGDGVSNQQEIELGSDPDDPESVPVDSNDDRDGDGYLNEDDAFPDDASEWEDLDGDGIGNNKDLDIDGDGINNNYEIELGFNPEDASNAPADLDGDGIPDLLDSDIDNDGIENEADAFPLDPNESSDMDGDGEGDNADLDRDGDGINNDQETQLGFDPNDPNNTPPDFDGDGIADPLDQDIDNDGHLNDQDIFPYDPTEWSDLDGDGVGDNSDLDRDGDTFNNDFEIERGTDPDDMQDYPDVIPPVISSVTTFNEAKKSTSIITGNITDERSGVAQVWVEHSAFEDVQFSVTLDETSQFYEQLPLVLGQNELNIIAIDNEDNRAEYKIIILLKSAPELEQVTPTNGGVVQQPDVIIRGVVSTFFEATDIRLQLEGVQLPLQELSSPADTRKYSFESHTVRLNIGDNVLELVAQTPDGLHVLPLEYSYIPQDADSIPLPEIILLSPSDGATLSGDSVPYAVLATSHAGKLSVSINGQSISNENLQSIQQINDTLILPSAEGSATLSITATDGLNRTSTQTFNFSIDNLPPVLSWNTPYIEKSLYSVVQSENTVTGEVGDDQLASLLINGESVAMRPSEAGRYEFMFNAQVLPGDSKTYVAEARDVAGNLSTSWITLENTAQLSLEWITPDEGFQLFTGEGSISLALTSTTEGIATNTRIQMMSVTEPVTTVASTQLAKEGNWLVGSLPIPQNAGSYRIQADVMGTDGSPLFSTSRNIVVTSMIDEALSVISTQPMQLDEQIDVDAPIVITFNKPVDPATIQVEIRQSVQGKSYVNTDDRQAKFYEQRGDVLTNVSLDREPVTVNVSLLPGEQMLAFYPVERLAFGARVDVVVTHNSQELNKFRYRTAVLPTLLNGRVIDVYMQPLDGVKVKLGSEYETITDDEGAYTFGYAGQAELKSGEYTLSINSGLDVKTYNNKIKMVNVRDQVINKVSSIILSKIDKASIGIHYKGQESLSLSDGELKLNLSEAELEIPEEYNDSISATFLSTSQLPYPAKPYRPWFMYQITPSGVTHNGNIAIEFNQPAYLGSYDYLDTVKDQAYVLLMASNLLTEEIEIVGVGLVDGLTIKSQALVHLNDLDLLGFVYTSIKHQQTLADYAAGIINIHQLRSAFNAN